MRIVMLLVPGSDIHAMPGPSEPDTARATQPDLPDSTPSRQAEAVAAELSAAPVRPAAVLTSPDPPAPDAASVVATRLSLPEPLQRDELAALSSRDGDIEALASMQERAWALVDELRAEHAEDASLVLVTHEPVIRALVCRALSMPLTELHRFALYPGSTTTIEFRTQPRERTLIASLNEVCHLERLASP